MIKLSITQILELYEKMNDATGGDYGLRSLGALESSIENAFVTFDGTDLYKSTEDKIANTTFCIINNHPYIDGNKRMGIYLMLILLRMNNIEIHYIQSELVKLGLGIANGKILQSDIVEWIEDHKNNSHK